MIWFTWRQHRMEAIIAGVLLLLIVCIVVITGLSIRNLYDQSGVAKCILPTVQCFQSLADFNSQAVTKAFGSSTFYNLFSIVLLALPPLVGVFLGAPAGAQELEQGTYRLVLTQGVPWYRWLVAKISLLSIATLSVFVLLFLLLFWWSQPLSNVLSTIWPFYDIRGIVLPAYALFSFALGFTAGILLRRTVPAMAIALVVFIVVRILIEIFWRPYFLPPLNFDYSISSTTAQIPPQSWIIAQETINRNNNVVSNSATSVCNTTGSASDFAACMDRYGFRLRTVYQPENRFWLFQGFESGIYLLLTGGFFVLTYWWVKHKII
jgi:hypothetical protein